MRLAEKYAVPAEFALLYDFVNSIDIRSFVEQGTPHKGADELATPAQLETWMLQRGLLTKGDVVSAADHRCALDLREAVRSYLQVAPENRADERCSAARLNGASEAYPLKLKVSNAGTITLEPASAGNRLGCAVAELFMLADAGHLDRLKMCDSDECHWVFYDRSKPGNRRWCSSSLCGNRQKTRAYRDRRRKAAVGS